MKLEKDLLNSLFRYQDGALFWRKSGSGRNTDKEAGYIERDGYRRIMLNRKHIPSHRIIYSMFHGDIADSLHIDHINGKRSDNRIENIRVVTIQENHFNRTSAKGYCFMKDRNKYKANIKIDGKSKHLGNFDTPEEARSAYLKAKESLHIIKDR